MADSQTLRNTQRALEDHLESVRRFTAETSALIEALPERNRHWAIGESEVTQPESLATWQGNPVSDNSWLEMFTAHNPQPSPEDELTLILPSAAMFQCVISPGNTSLTRVMNSYQRIRILVQGPLSTERSAPTEQFFVRGHDARVHPRLPVFMCSDTKFHLSCPDTNELIEPSNMHLVRSPLIAGITSSLFHNLWTEALSLPHHTHMHEWSTLLQLLFRGETLETASRELGFSTRTARQRLHGAYAHYGVDNLFALGLAWGNNIAEEPESGAYC